LAEKTTDKNHTDRKRTRKTQTKKKNDKTSFPRRGERKTGRSIEEEKRGEKHQGGKKEKAADDIHGKVRTKIDGGIYRQSRRAKEPLIKNEVAKTKVLSGLAKVFGKAIPTTQEKKKPGGRLGGESCGEK